MNFRPRLPILLLFLAYASTLWAADPTYDSEFDNSLFNLPKGWSKVEKDGAMQLLPPGLAAGEQVMIVITPGGVLKADFATAFKEYRGLLRGNFTAHESDTQSATADEGYPVLYTAEKLDDPTGNRHQWRFYLASSPGKRIEMVMLLASSEQLYQRYSPAFEEFAKTLSYKNVRPGAHPTSAPSTQPENK